MTFVRFENKRIKLEFGALIGELDARPDPVKESWRKKDREPIDLLAPLTVSPALAASNAAHARSLASFRDDAA